jgi:sugar/nucleoside kinase (ribokinase family)
MVKPGRTFAWQGEYDQKDFNTAITLSTELGVLEGYTPEVNLKHQNLSHVFLANFDPDNQYQFFQLMKNPQLVGMDTMNLWINIKKKSVLKLMKKVDLFVANDGEARAITGESNLIKAARALRKIGPQWIVVKKGEHGVLFYCDQFMFSFSAYPVDKVIDPTGAGDTFAGGLMGYLSKVDRINEKTLRKAAIYATTLSSFNVEGFGVSRTEALTLKDANQRMRTLVKFIQP